ncbi:MAG: molybdenum cofactor biosynthesis protein MoaE [Tistlia sp.]|uniref:molybdenum cofactor biosynthesis protein MoaE n=1 Tax=Tistlia sp. TaxID=3057121 RepID=UPI0034A26C67
MSVRVQRESFDLGRELAALSAGNLAVGGLASFVGLVRDFDDPAGRSPQGGTALAAMTLEHYPGMTEKMLERIEAEANRRWELEASLIVHRYGRMEPGEPIVLVACASAHRQAALEACQFLIDWLKTQAPFWKVEETAEGEGRWVEARDSDEAAAARWLQKPKAAE